MFDCKVAKIVQIQCLISRFHVRLQARQYKIQLGLKVKILQRYKHYKFQTFIEDFVKLHYDVIHVYRKATLARTQRSTSSLPGYLSICSSLSEPAQYKPTEDLLSSSECNSVFSNRKEQFVC